MRSLFLSAFFLLFSTTFFLSCNSEGQQKPEVTQKEDTKEGLSTNSTTKTIMCFGNSLTAGYGLEDDASFPSLLQEKINAENLDYKVINAGLSGETSAGGLNRIDWMLRQKIDVFLLELGGNDGLRGLPTDQMEKNLQQILDKVKAKYPSAKIIIAAMEAPPNLGDTYTQSFRAVYKNLAQKNKITYLPFFLEGVAGDPKLNLPDMIHPNEEGQKIVATNIWKTLKPLL